MASAGMSKTNQPNAQVGIRVTWYLIILQYIASKAVSTPVPVANWTLATRALESGLRPHDDRPLTGREPFAPS